MEPIHAVLFDLHTTLVDGGDPLEWLQLAYQGADEELPADVEAEVAFLDDMWTHARHIDPNDERDLDSTVHREMYDVMFAYARTELGIDLSPAVADALYQVMPDLWRPYVDAAPVLRSLRSIGIKVALVSNVGIDVMPILERSGLAPLLDEVVLSLHVGAVKPAPRIFTTALDGLGVDPAQALMVGDTPSADAGGVALGIRTLLLPRTPGRVKGLELVCRIVGAPVPDPAEYVDES